VGLVLRPTFSQGGYNRRPLRRESDGLRFALGLPAMTVFLPSHDSVGPETGPWPRLGDRSSVQSPTVMPANMMSSGAVGSGVEVCEIIPVRGYTLRTWWQGHSWLMRPSRAAGSNGRQNEETFNRKRSFVSNKF
jgi:hypothetical protein